MKNFSRTPKPRGGRTRFRTPSAFRSAVARQTAILTATYKKRK